jgi:hypothetical protein
MGHPDFRLRGKIFASLPKPGQGVVKLTPEQQDVLRAAEPAIFAPAAGAWGRQGWTVVTLAAADLPTLQSALAAAWRNVAEHAGIGGIGPVLTDTPTQVVDGTRPGSRRPASTA